jgi:hypothetical protein
MTKNEVRYLVIEPSGAITAHTGILNTGDAQDIVGGPIDILPEPRDVAATLIANEEGKRMGLDANWAATRLIKSRLRTTDFVVGNVIVAGLADGNGNLTSLTDEEEQAVRDICASE